MSSASTLGFLDWLDDSTAYRCNAMVVTAWALKPKLLLLHPMLYDAYATPAHTHTHAVFYAQHQYHPRSRVHLEETDRFPRHLLRPLSTRP